MRFLDRLEKLAGIIGAAGGEIVGKTKIQKLIFLAQEKGFYLGYDYAYHHYGVFSPDLESDLRLGEAFDFFTIEETLGQGNPTKTSLVAPEEYAYSDSDDPALKMVRELASKRSRVLEVLSTMVYLKNMRYEGEEFENNLVALKGHLREFFDEARELFRLHFAD